MFQFIYNRGGAENEPGFGLPRSSVDCVQEEEEAMEEADEEALNTMCRWRSDSSFYKVYKNHTYCIC